jgi:hypothetical protein
MKMNVRLLALLIIIMIGLSACGKNNDAPAVYPVSAVSFTNASADSVNLYSNGTRLNSTSNLLPGFSTVYYSVNSGQQAFQVKKPFNPQTNSIQTLFSFPLDMQANQAYSIFITDQTAGNAFSTADNLQTDTARNTCLVRFVNASPDAGSLDMTVGTTSFKNLAFKSASAFMPVNITAGASATGLITIQIFKSGSATPLAQDSVPLSQNSSYTFYSKGKIAGTGNTALGIGATINL